MPKRLDIKKILVIGSGPIVIGQACEFDYSGTQACKVLRAEGYKVVLVNSNPATIMTDPELADRTYIEPLTPEYLEAIILKEMPDALLPTVGGQTALNLAVALSEKGILDKQGVELIGAQIESIKVGEDRLLFKEAMREIGLETAAQRGGLRLPGGPADRQGSGVPGYYPALLYSGRHWWRHCLQRRGVRATGQAGAGSQPGP